MRRRLEKSAARLAEKARLIAGIRERNSAVITAARVGPAAASPGIECAATADGAADTGEAMEAAGTSTVLTGKAAADVSSSSEAVTTPGASVAGSVISGAATGSVECNSVPVETSGTAQDVTAFSGDADGEGVGTTAGGETATAGVEKNANADVRHYSQGFWGLKSAYGDYSRVFGSQVRSVGESVRDTA